MLITLWGNCRARFSSRFRRRPNYGRPGHRRESRSFLVRDRSDERAALPGRIPAWQNGACRYGAGRETSSPTTPSISSPPHKVMASPKSARRPRASARREPPRLCAASRGRSEPLRFIISRRDMSAWADASLNLRCRSPVRVLHHNRRPGRKAASSNAGWRSRSGPRMGIYGTNRRRHKPMQQFWRR